MLLQRHSFRLNNFPPCNLIITFSTSVQAVKLGKMKLSTGALTLSRYKTSTVKAVAASLGFRLHLETTSRQNSFPSSGRSGEGDGQAGKEEKSRSQGEKKKRREKREQVANTHTQLFLDIILGKIIKVGLYSILACRLRAFKSVFNTMAAFFITFFFKATCRQDNIQT